MNQNPIPELQYFKLMARSSNSSIRLCAVELLRGVLECENFDYDSVLDDLDRLKKDREPLIREFAEEICLDYGVNETTVDARDDLTSNCESRKAVVTEVKAKNKSKDFLEIIKKDLGDQDSAVVNRALSQLWKNETIRKQFIC